MPVRIFKERWAELGDPKISLFVAKLAKPTFSCGIFRRIIAIKIKLMTNEKTFNMFINYFIKKY